MKKILALLLTLSSNFFHAQETKFTVPDYEKIKKNISDKESTHYYPKLLKRLRENDVSLTKEDYQHLYYGYSYQPEYDPYKVSSNDEKLRKYYKNIESNQYKTFIKLAKKSLRKNPFDLRVMNFLGYVYYLKGDETASKKVSKTFKGIIDVIRSSGDGLKYETGFHVIQIGHEYELLNLFGLEIKSQDLIDSCDYFGFEKGKYEMDGLYFNIKQIQTKVFSILNEE